MVRVQVKLTRQGEQALRTMQHPERWLPRAVHEITLHVARRIRIEAQRNAPVRTGGGRRRIRERPTRRGHAVVSDLHMLVMDEGRRPGAAMPPVAPLERWGRRTLGKRGLGFALAISIARKGIKPRRFFAKAIRLVTERERVRLERDLARIIRRVLQRAAKEGR